MSAADTADTVPQVYAIHATGSFHWTMVNREYDGIALAQRHHLGAGLHPRPLLSEDELTAGEVFFRLGKQNRHLQGEHVLAVEILVQAVVIARPILQKQWCGPGLAGLGTAGTKLSVLSRITHGYAERFVPPVRNRRQPRVEGSSKLANRLREG